jgi:hypothetical protein
MTEACAVVVTLVIDEDLRFVFETPKRPGMDDAVAVALKSSSGRAFGLGKEPAPAFLGLGGKNGGGGWV